MRGARFSICAGRRMSLKSSVPTATTRPPVENRGRSSGGEETEVGKGFRRTGDGVPTLGPCDCDAGFEGTSICAGLAVFSRVTVWIVDEEAAKSLLETGANEGCECSMTHDPPFNRGLVDS